MKGNGITPGWFRGLREAARGAGGAIGVVVRVMQRRTGFLDVRPRIGSSAPFEQRREGQEDLCDGEEAHRRTP